MDIVVTSNFSSIWRPLLHLVGRRRLSVCWELLVTRWWILEDDIKQLVYNHLQATIGQLEQLAMTDSYAGSRSRLYSLVESVSDIHSDASVVH